MKWKRLMRQRNLLLGLMAVGLSYASATVAGAGGGGKKKPSGGESAQKTPTASAAPAPAASHPRLVVLIVVDQLRADYLTRFAPHFGQGGFARFFRGGADFRNAYFAYGSSATAPGHATIATGAQPRRHGIVGNEWYLEPGSQKLQLPIADDEARMLGLPEGSEGAGYSPKWLIGSTLGDQLKLADKRSRVFSLSFKDRAAIFLGGHAADGACWYHSGSGGFVTSSYYVEAVPSWLAAFNESKPADRLAGKRWEPLGPPSWYEGCYALDASWLPDLEKLGAAFPHTLPGEAGKELYELVRATPFSNDLLLDLVEQVVKTEKLGQGPATDLLCVSFSSNDYAGHVFGPESAEVLDMTLRTDSQIERLFGIVDRAVGPGKALFALSADHGATSSPRIAQQLKIPVGLVDQEKTTQQLNEGLKKLGVEMPEGPLVLGVNLPWIYMDPAFNAVDNRLDGNLTASILAVLRKTPGIAAAFSCEGFLDHPPPPWDQERYLAWQCYHPERSGRFYVRLDPFWFKQGDDFAGHTMGFSADRHVPILLEGPGVRPGVYYQPADPADVAVTLAALLGIEPPSEATGRVLGEAIGSAAAASGEKGQKEAPSSKSDQEALTEKLAKKALEQLNKAQNAPKKGDAAKKNEKGTPGNPGEEKKKKKPE